MMIAKTHRRHAVAGNAVVRQKRFNGSCPRQSQCVVVGIRMMNGAVVRVAFNANAVPGVARSQQVHNP